MRLKSKRFHDALEFGNYILYSLLSQVTLHNKVQDLTAARREIDGGGGGAPMQNARRRRSQKGGGAAGAAWGSTYSSKPK